MPQAYMGMTGAVDESHANGIEQVASLVAAYRRGKRSNIATHETDHLMSVGLDLQVLTQLAQFDKLLIALK